MAEAVYILCAATSLACAVLLFRGYTRTRAQFLLWSSLCFVGLALNNMLLFADFMVGPSIDLSMPRNFAALAGLTVLVLGFIWDSK